MLGHQNFKIIDTKIVCKITQNIVEVRRGSLKLFEVATTKI